MVTSKEAIEYVKKNLDMKNCLTVFYAGSIPEELIPESDLDIFIVMKKGKENQLLNNVNNIMNKYVKKNKSVTYSFYRGPFKYKHKGLIHFITYTEDVKKRASLGSAFSQEMIHVLKTLRKTAKVISGKPISEIYKGINLKDAKTSAIHKQRSLTKYAMIKNTGRIKYREWKKTKNGWRFLYTNKKASKFLKEYLIGYYVKHWNIIRGKTK